MQVHPDYIKNSVLEDLYIEKITDKQDLPIELLLLADETPETIDKYIHNADTYIVRQIECVAAFVLQPISEADIELKNIAVAETFQGRGVGSWIIGKIKDIAVKQEFRTLWVGTPDGGSREIRFYEKNGFIKAYLKRNFYVDNYPEPIFDHDVQLRHMQMLRLDII
jgi:ribosomal protein S18 acetylase RimI-like enzyme